MDVAMATTGSATCCASLDLGPTINDCQEKGGEIVLGTESLRIVPVHHITGDSLALSLNQELVSKFQRTRAAISKCADARNELCSKEDEIYMERVAAQSELSHARTDLDMVKRKIYKFPGRAPQELRSVACKLQNRYLNACQNQDEVEKKKSKLSSAVREAEREHYNLLQDIQDACVAALEQVGLMDMLPADNAETSSTATRKLAVPKSRLQGNKDVKMDRRNSSPPETNTETIRPTSPPPEEPKKPKKPTLGFPEDIEKTVNAAQYEQEQRERLRNAEEALYDHRDTYDEQLHEFAMEQGQEIKEVETKFGPLYFKRFIEATASIGDAERAWEQAREAAKAVGVPDTEDQKSDFYAGSDKSQPGPEYNESHIAASDPSKVEEWIEEIRNPKRRKVQPHSSSSETSTEEAGDSSSISAESPRLLDKEELQFQFSNTLKTVEDVEDNLSDAAESPRRQKKIRGWKERCAKWANREDARGRGRLPGRRQRSKSLLPLQSRPPPADDPGFASDRPPYDPLPTPDLDNIRMTESVVIVTQAPPDSWAKAAARKRKRLAQGPEE